MRPPQPLRLRCGSNFCRVAFLDRARENFLTAFFFFTHPASPALALASAAAFAVAEAIFWEIAAAAAAAADVGLANTSLSAICMICIHTRIRALIDVQLNMYTAV